MTHSRGMLLIGCGILMKEVAFLIKKNGWPLETRFLDSALHCEPDRLAATLTSSLETHQGRPRIIFYGCCSPQMDRIVETAGAVRTEGRNCIEMLLGRETYEHKLANGAFFLLEGWAETWKRMITKSFGTERTEVISDIFQGSHSHLLCIRTPCAQDFSKSAEAAGRLVNLPLHWMDVSLDRLEAVLKSAVENATRILSWTT